MKLDAAVSRIKIGTVREKALEHDGDEAGSQEDQPGESSCFCKFPGEDSCCFLWMWGIVLLAASTSVIHMAQCEAM